MARDAIAAALAVPSDTIAVDLLVPQVAPLLRDVWEARSLRAAAVDAEEHSLAQAARALFEELRVSQGDACRLLGMSQQEVARLLPVHASGGSSSWRLDAPPPSTGVPARTNRSSGELPQHLTGQQRRRPALANQPLDNAVPTRPERRRSPSATRPSWAIADDD
ncbi:UPF0175 family protein [Streptantibioticus rubrisoli]|uniref:UPF0175 family protein n=1 Tax=Streptantibioticus rubrisoli TaxID=1387313 RepID=A0ABT1PBG0_9ACTN|nr:UPF0175 family protein [Streptantibioticus rubrisoli]MCQ4042707.1 UPF0175 family protein [Streptantibioticus rubrisoli]